MPYMFSGIQFLVTLLVFFSLILEIMRILQLKWIDTTLQIVFKCKVCKTKTCAHLFSHHNGSSVNKMYCPVLEGRSATWKLTYSLKAKHYDDPYIATLILCVLRMGCTGTADRVHVLA
jgi:hypothetical protein